MATYKCIHYFDTHAKCIADCRRLERRQISRNLAGGPVWLFTRASMSPKDVPV